MNLPCESCKGTGITVNEGFTSLDGKIYPRTERACFACSGSGDFPPIDVDAILVAIIATKGKNKGSLRASMVSPVKTPTYCTDARAYYVWRLARFHGGKDMTMPMMASCCIHGDPFRDALDTMSEQVAKTYLGSDLHATMRWGRAFGLV